MRSLTDLQAEAKEYGLEWVGLSREELMDRLRDRLGTTDPSLTVDPMKAQDLKRKLDWSDDYLGVPQFLTSKQWLAEPKIDGARLRMFMGTTANSLNTGRRSVVTYAYTDRSNNFPHLRDAVVPELAGTILDGEVLAPKESITTQSGVVTQSWLNSTMALVNVNPNAAWETQQREGKVRYFIFDILAHKGDSLKLVPYIQRRDRLAQVVEQLTALCPEIQLIPCMEASPDVVRDFIVQGFEGAMLKHVDGLYETGKRSKFWQKIKKFGTGDFFIIGSIPGKGRNQGLVGSLKVAYMDFSRSVPTPVYVADVGGFTDDFRRDLTGPDGNVALKWVGAVIEVHAQGLTKDHRLRHPHFMRVRPDKTPDECGVEQLAPFPAV